MQNQDMPHTGFTVSQTLPSYRRSCSDEQFQHSAQRTSETCSPTCSPTCSNTTIPRSVPIQAQRLHIVVDASGSYQYREQWVSACKHVQTRAPKACHRITTGPLQSTSSSIESCNAIKIKQQSKVPSVPNFIDTSWTLASDMFP